MSATALYSLHLHNVSKEALSLARIAEYLADFAKLLGSAEHVHFSSIDDGSVILRAAVDDEVKGIVSPRIRSVSRGEADGEVSQAWRRLNEKISCDSASADLTMPGGELIYFPGAPKPDKPVGPVRQWTSVQGRLVRLEGDGDKVYVGIDDETGVARQIVIPVDRGRDLGVHFHRFVRLSGMGRWKRDTRGKWTLERLEADTFEPLQDEPVADVLRKVRDLMPSGSGSSVVEEIKDLRRA